MAPFRFEYTRTPTDEPSFTEKSWKGSSNTLVAECGTEDRESKKSRFWVWWNRTPKQGSSLSCYVIDCLLT